MDAREIQGHKANARETFVQHAHANADVSASALPGDAISSIKSSRDYSLEPMAENGFYEPADTSLLPVTRVNPANLTPVLRQLEVIAKRQAPRMAFKAKGRILFLDLDEIVAVQAKGNYVSLRHRANSYLLRESLSSMAENLKPYGFIRIHRSVVVNISAVEEIQPLPTGVYYSVARSYKDNLRELAQLWLGSERLCG